jgi:hypothetical protein
MRASLHEAPSEVKIAKRRMILVKRAHFITSPALIRDTQRSSYCQSSKSQ